MKIDRRILELALQGLEAERRRLELEIFELRKRLHPSGSLRNRVDSDSRSEVPKRNISDSGRKAISDAMKKRWAKFRRQRSK
jgi:hypothetical protein